MAEPWHPSISIKQAGIINDFGHSIRLLSGPRKASKTIGGLHCLCHHAWTTKNANISMLGRTLTDNFDSGAWSDLVDSIIPEWESGDFGFEVTKQPKLHALTHKLSIEVSNVHGGISRIQLDSIKNETAKEAERIYKGKRFSMVYVTEASNFQHRTTFDIIEESLRRLDLLPEEHLMILDTNPAPEGEDSWLYKLFYVFRMMAEEELMENFVDPDLPPDKQLEFLRGLKELQNKLSVHEFSIDDNPFLTEAQKRAQFAKYAHNKDLLDRYYYGLWTKAALESVFQEVFRPSIHIIGDSPDARGDELETMVPEDNCSALGSGWDLGDINHGIQIIEDSFRIELENKTIPSDVQGQDGRIIEVEKQVTVFKILDEFVLTGMPFPLVEIVSEVLDIMDYWEEIIGQPVPWTNISDRSAFDRYNKSVDAYEYQEVFVASEGRIELREGPAKKRHSIQQRLNLTRKLFFQDRLFVSARCVKTIEMFNGLRRGRITPIDMQSPHKHPFDSLTYYLSLKCFAEMEREVRNRTRSETKPSYKKIRF